MANLLLRAGADVGDEDGHTALMEAARIGDLTLTRALVKAGAHPEATDDIGQTAITFAKSAGRQEVASYLTNTSTATPEAKEQRLPRAEWKRRLAA